MSDHSDALPAAQRIAAFLARPSEEIPGDAIAAAKVILLNGLRAALAARDEPVARRLIASQPAAPGRGEGGAVFWSDVRTHGDHAAVCNQFLWTMLMLDDVELTTGMHPGGPAAIAALARAEGRPVSGLKLLAAIVAGIEVQIAVAQAGAPQMLQDRGFAPMSVFAPLGAAAAGAVIDGPPAHQLANAIGIAAMSGGGMWEMGGTSSAMFLTAQGTGCGLAALRAANCGIEAPERALDGPFGAYRAYTGKAIETLYDSLDTLGDVWRTPTVLVQPYSGDTYSQAPLEAVARILAEGPIALDAIRSVTVLTDERTALGVGRKVARHPVLRDALSLNSDPPARVAAALLRGSFSWDGAFDALVHDAAVADLRNRTRFARDSSIPDMTSTVVEVHLAGGAVRRARVDGFVGSPRNPQTYDGMTVLFRGEADDRLGADRAGRVVAMIAGLDEAGDVAALVREITSPTVSQ
jgi:2-methylcitrate dehydratase PrpD